MVGALFMTLVFMAAIGVQVYMSGQQVQASQSASAVQLRLAQRADEDLAFVATRSALQATNTGPSAETIVAMVLKFENGTVYNLGSATTPALAAATVSPSGQLSVGPLVPQGVCSPGTATCLSKYSSIVGSTVPGRSVGLVTSLGNTFWYVPSAGGGSSDATVYRTTSAQTTTSSTFVAIPGLSFVGAANSFYTVQLYMPYYQSSSANAVIAFAVSVPVGATFVFCGGLFWANPAQSTTDFSPGNLCNSTPNSSLGPTANSQTWCTQQGVNMCEFVGTAFVSFGSSSGTFQFEFEGASTDTATVLANAVVVVAQA